MSSLNIEKQVEERTYMRDSLISVTQFPYSVKIGFIIKVWKFYFYVYSTSRRPLTNNL